MLLYKDNTFDATPRTKLFCFSLFCDLKNTMARYKVDLWCRDFEGLHSLKTN